MAERLKIGGYAESNRRVSTPRATVSSYERGRRIPPPEVLERYIAIPGSDRDNLQRLAAAAQAPSRPQLERPQSEHLESEPAKSNPEASSLDQLPQREPRRLGARRVAVAGVAVAAAVIIGALVWYPAGPSGRRNEVLPVRTWTETTGTPARTWSDYKTAGGKAGEPLGPRQSVQVSCRIRGFIVQDGDPWWYRIESSPWNGDYYATSDAFYNQGSTSGPVDNGVIVDEQVPEC